MGQKVNPKIFRIGPLFTWDSKWFARKAHFADQLRADLAIRSFVQKELKAGAVARLEIERTPNSVTVIIHSARPGVVIGRQGAGVEELKKKFKLRFFPNQKITININIVEVDRPTINAQLVTQGVIEEIERRLPYRRIMKQTIERVQKGGAQGVKVMIAGRLNGAEIANCETLSWGKVPLHTLRANIDYSRGTAHTAMGTIGVKVWIYKGEEFTKT